MIQTRYSTNVDQRGGKCMRKLILVQLSFRFVCGRSMGPTSRFFRPIVDRRRRESLETAGSLGQASQFEKLLQPPHSLTLRSHDDWFSHHRHRRLLHDGHGGRADGAPAVDLAPLLLPGHLGAPPPSTTFHWKGGVALLPGKQGHCFANQSLR